MNQSSKEQIDLSIIIINWRMCADLEGVLPCIRDHQHRCRIETLLINKPSGDGTEELILHEHQWVKLVTHEKFGIAEMRNVGIEKAKGRYVLMLDADTELLPGCLDALVDFMDKYPEVGGCGGHTTRLNGELEYNVKRFYDFMTVLVRRSPLQKLFPNNPWSYRHLMMDKNHQRPFLGDWMAGACFCMRAKAIQQVGFFDDRYYFGFEDVDWCWRAKAAGWKVAFNPRAKIIHKVQRLSDRGWNKMAWEHLKSGVRFWWKVRHQGLNWTWPQRPNARLAEKNFQKLAPADSDTTRPDLSVVVINLNGKQLLDDCLESLQIAAPDHKLEVLVVDNGSTDGSTEMVEEKYPDVILTKNRENMGFTKANNQGIEKSTGRYIVLLNNDTRVVRGAFSIAIETLDRKPEVGAAGLKLLNEDGSLQLSCRRFPSFSQALFNRYSLLTKLFPNNPFSRSYLMTDIRHDRVEEVDWVSGACLLFRRSVLDKIGPLDERYFMYSEDVDYCYRVWEEGLKVVYLPMAQVYHLIGQDTKKVRVKLTIERHKSMYKFYKKHYSRSLMFMDAITGVVVTIRCLIQLAVAYIQVMKESKGGSAA